ncbi:hypothetical protein [Cohaesibacter celericrescens]
MRTLAVADGVSVDKDETALAVLERVAGWLSALLATALQPPPIVE